MDTLKSKVVQIFLSKQELEHLNRTGWVCVRDANGYGLKIKIDKDEVD